MAPPGRSGGNTPKILVKLVTEAVKKSSQSSVARESGVALLTIQRCLKGIGDPTSATLDKFSKYFKVSVKFLRGEEEFKDVINIVTSSVAIGLPKEITKGLLIKLGFDEHESTYIYEIIADGFKKDLLPKLEKGIDEAINKLLRESHETLLKFSPSEIVFVHRVLEQLANNTEFWVAVEKLLPETPEPDLKSILKIKE